MTVVHLPNLDCEFVAVVVYDEIANLGRFRRNTEELCRIVSAVRPQRTWQRREERIGELG